MGNHPKTTLKTDVLQSQSAQGPMLYTLQVFLPMPSRQVATNTSFLGPMRGVRYRYNMGFEWFRTFMTHIHFLCSARWFGIIQLKQSQKTGCLEFQTPKNTANNLGFSSLPIWIFFQRNGIWSPPQIAGRNRAFSLSAMWAGWSETETKNTQDG